MNTNSTVRVAAASVIGARHQRAGRNGQDAAVATSGEGVAVVVVCDGCSSGTGSEVGARLGAKLFADKLGARLRSGACVRERSVWEAVRAEVGEVLVAALGNQIVEVQAVHEFLLFTIVAAAVTAEGAAVWALGDGAYGWGSACGSEHEVRRLGPFANNEPPYLGYDLLGAPQVAAFEVAPDHVRRIIVATDGIDDLDGELAMFAAPKLVEHPDALRRLLAQLAKADERIDWGAARVSRIPARLQDDCAVGIIAIGDAS